MAHRLPISLFWFRRDLRLHDNTALIQATHGKYPVLPIFIFDKDILNKIENREDPRVTFIHSTLAALKVELEQHGTTLQTFYSKPENAFHRLFKQYNIKAVYSNRDYEPSALARDITIESMSQKAGAQFYSFKDHVIFEATEVLKQDGTPFKVFTPFKRAWLTQYEQPKSSGEIALPDFQNLMKANPAPFPALSEMGFEAYSGYIPTKTPNEGIISSYDKTRDFPAQLGTTKLGIHLRFGTISIREMVTLAFNLNETWLNELIWREFYSYIIQHFPYVTERAFNKKYDKIPWLNSESDFEKWCNGLTGYPIVDAGMRELNTTGYMHNRVRMITASFLTKHLLIDWRWGEAYFASRLLDYELASNNGGWQWAAGTGTDAQPWFRIFNPYAQAEKFDPQGEYIKKWVPEFNTPAYPPPMIDHKKARERVLTTFKSVIA